MPLLLVQFQEIWYDSSTRASCSLLYCKRMSQDPFTVKMYKGRVINKKEKKRLLYLHPSDQNWKISSQWRSRQGTVFLGWRFGVLESPMMELGGWYNNNYIDFQLAKYFNKDPKLWNWQVMDAWMEAIIISPPWPPCTTTTTIWEHSIRFKW